MSDNWRDYAEPIEAATPVGEDWQDYAEPVEDRESPPTGDAAKNMFEKSRGFKKRVERDIVVAAGKGLVAVPQAVTGLAGMVGLPGGHVAKLAMKKTGKRAVSPYGWAGWLQEKMGLDYEGVQEVLQSAYSPETQEASKKFQEAEGVLEKTQTAIMNPSTILTTIGESIPMMVTGGVIGRGIQGAKALGPVAKYGYAIGEGLMAAGSSAEQTRAQSPNKLLSEKQAALSAGSGVLTAIIGAIGGVAANKLGALDIEQLLSGQISNKVKQNILVRVLGGAVSEAGEETAQSAQEQIASNLANDKPWHEGWDDAVVLGALSGGVMGGGINLTPGQSRVKEKRARGEDISRREATAAGIEGRHVADRNKAADQMLEEQDREQRSTEAGPGEQTTYAVPLEEPAVIKELAAQRVPVKKVAQPKPPGREELRPAAIGADGQLYYGQPGEEHHGLMKEPAVAEAVRQGKDPMGYAHGGKFYTREEAVGLKKDIETPLFSEPDADRVEKITSEAIADPAAGPVRKVKVVPVGGPQRIAGSRPAGSRPAGSRPAGMQPASQKQTRARILEVFPGAKLEPSETGGWHVRIGDSYVQIETVSNIPLHRASVEAEYGKMTDVQFAAKSAAAAFSLTFPDGTKHSGFGLIRLAEGLSDPRMGKALRHEALHLAKKLNLFSKKEWDALVKAHAAEDLAAGKSEGEIENKIANAMGATDLSGENVWKRIAASIRRMIAKLTGITQYQAKDIHLKMHEAGFWSRLSMEEKQKVEGRGHTAASIDSNRFGAQDQIPMVPNESSPVANEMAKAPEVQYVLDSSKVQLGEVTGKLTPQSKQVLRMIRKYAEIDAELYTWMKTNHPAGQKKRQSAFHYNKALEANPKIRARLVALDKKAHAAGLLEKEVFDAEKGEIHPYMLENYPKVWENVFASELQHPEDSQSAIVSGRTRNPYDAKEKKERTAWNAGYKAKAVPKNLELKKAYNRGVKARKASKGRWFVTDQPIRKPGKFEGQRFVSNKVSGPFDTEAETRAEVKKIKEQGGKVDRSRPEFSGISRSLAQTFLEQIKNDHFFKLQRQLTAAVEEVYDNSLLGREIPALPLNAEFDLNKTREVVGRTDPEYNVYSTTAEAHKTYMALNQNVVCPMLMVSNGSCYGNACYLVAAAKQSMNQNWYQKGMYTGEILELAEGEIKELRSTGGLRLNGAGDITSWTYPQMVDIFRHAKKRNLPLKIITKQEQTFEVISKVAKELGEDMPEYQIQPSIDPYWIPVSADDMVGSPLEGYTDAIKRAHKAGDHGAAELLLDTAERHYQLSGRETRRDMMQGGWPMVYRKWGMSFGRVAALVKQYSSLEGHIQPRTLVVSPKEVIYYLKNHPDAVETFMHGKVPPGVVYSEVHGGFLQDGEIANWPGENIIEKDENGRWQVLLAKSETNIERTKWTDAITDAMYAEFPADQIDTQFEKLRRMVCCQHKRGGSEDACMDCMTHCAMGPKANPENPADALVQITPIGLDGRPITEQYSLEWADEVDPKEFIEGRNTTTRPGYLSPLEPEDITDHKLFLSQDGRVGVAVSPEGDVQNVFNNGGPKGAGHQAVDDAIAAGGKTLDCFDGFLPKFYSQHGFVETGRVGFNREFAPKEWNYEKEGEPDVVFMALNPIKAESKKYTDWDEAKEASQEVARNNIAVEEQYSVGDRANPATDPSARSLVDMFDEVAGDPKRRPDAEVQAEATKRLAADYAGEKAKLLETGASGEGLGDTETVMAKEIINREGKIAMASGDHQMIQNSMDLIAAYRRTGAQQARAFRQRHDPVESPAQRAERLLTESILVPPPKVREAIERALKKGNRKKAAQLNKQQADKFEKVKKALVDLGIDVADLFGDGYSTTKAARILRTIQPIKTEGGYDAAYEFWNNAILSAPTTQAANIIGNTAYGVWRLTAVRFTEAMLNKVANRPEGAQLEEFQWMMAGFLPGLSLASQNFLRSWSTEFGTLEQQLGYSDISKIEEAPGAIAGTWGRVIRVPWRMLRAADDFSKTLVASIEVGAFAYRSAKVQGLEGAQMQAWIAMQMRDSSSDAWAKAYSSSLESAFQQEGGETLQFMKKGLLSFRRQVPFVRYILPFVNTPMNIFATGVRISPLGTVGTAHKMLKNLKEGDPLMQDATAQAAENILALAVIMALMSSDDDDPWITGAEKSLSPGGRREGYRTHPPLSVNIGGNWYSYSRLEPFATTIGLTIDGINGFRRGPKETFEMPMKALFGQMRDKTFLSGIGDIIDIIDSASNEPGSPGMIEATAKWGSRFGASWVPNIFRSTSREMSDTYANRRVWGKGGEFFARLVKRTVQNTEIPIFADQPVYNVWGRPANRSQIPMMSDWVYRIMIPIRAQKDDIFLGDRVILNWNNANPGAKERYPQPPQVFYRKGGETYYWTEEEYAALCRISGELAQQGVLKYEDEFNPNKPTLKQVEFVGKIAARARAQAKILVLSGQY